MPLPLQVAELMAIPVVLVLILAMARYRQYRADHATGEPRRRSSILLDPLPFPFARLLLGFAVVGIGLAAIAVLVTTLHP